MNRLLAILIFFALACENDKKTTDPVVESSDTTSTETVNYPYTADYTAQLDKGKTKHVKIIMDLWKAWDNNDFESSRNALGDSVTFIFSNGEMMNTTRDSIIASSKKYRSQYSSVKSSVAAWMPLTAKDKNEDWVAIWGSEVSVRNGKTDSIDIHEIWRLDANDKVIFMRQYNGKKPK